MKRFFVKMLLILVLVVVSLFNYKIISFNDGFKTVTRFEDLSTVYAMMYYDGEDLENIYYYRTPFSSDNYTLLFKTQKSVYMTTNITETELLVFKANDSIATDKPYLKKVVVIPVWLYVIIFLIIIFFPKFKKWTKNKITKITLYINPLIFLKRNILIINHS